MLRGQTAWAWLASNAPRRPGLLKKFSKTPEDAEDAEGLRFSQGGVVSNGGEQIAKFDRHRRCLGQARPTMVELDRVWPMLSNVGRLCLISAEFKQILTDFGQIWSTIPHTLSTRLRSMLLQCAAQKSAGRSDRRPRRFERVGSRLRGHRDAESTQTEPSSHKTEDA